MSTIPMNEQLREVGERAMKRAREEFVRKDIERLKQTGEYAELVKKRQAVLDAQKNKNGTPISAAPPLENYTVALGEG